MIVSERLHDNALLSVHTGGWSVLQLLVTREGSPPLCDTAQRAHMCFTMLESLHVRVVNSHLCRQAMQVTNLHVLGLGLQGQFIVFVLLVLLICLLDQIRHSHTFIACALCALECGVSHMGRDQLAFFFVANDESRCCSLRVTI